MNSGSIEKWDIEVSSKQSFFSFNILSLWKYRDLIFLFVKRDFISVYKQTVLGPLWFIIQPLLTTITFSIVFGGIAKLSTGSIPQPVFYMSGVICWSFFANCVTKTSSTFISNASIFGKVYFPRLCVPVSVVISNFLSFFIQLIIFLILLFYFGNNSLGSVVINWSQLWILPLLLILMALMGLGSGIIISSITTKYRDLTFLVGFGIQLLMYCSSVIFCLPAVSDKFKSLIMLNPMTPVIELFRQIFLATNFDAQVYILYSVVFTVIVLLFGVMLFNKVEKDFMDTV